MGARPLGTSTLTSAVVGPKELPLSLSPLIWPAASVVKVHLSPALARDRSPVVVVMSSKGGEEETVVWSTPTAIPTLRAVLPSTPGCGRGAGGPAGRHPIRTTDASRATRSGRPAWCAA